MDAYTSLNLDEQFQSEMFYLAPSSKKA